MNTVNGKRYIGSRQTNLLPSLDIGVEYFSSSLDKDFIYDQKVNNDHYKYTVLKEFGTRADAISFEIYLHNKFDVGVNESFYNRSKQTSIGWDRAGVKHSDDTRALISQRALGRVSPRRGATHSEEAKLRMRQNHGDCTGANNNMFGKNHSDESKKLMSLRQKNRERATCPHCNKTADIANMKRWHFDNCKEKS
jgi:hypothetical protein